MAVTKKQTRKKSATRKPAAKKKATRKVTIQKSTTKKSAEKKTSTKAKKYGAGASQAVEKEMHDFKRGKAHSGPKKKPVKSKEQAIAIGLSKARKKGIKVPKKKA